MIKKIYTFGCSFTKDNYHSTWADLVAKDLMLELDNRAERGASAEFVVNRLMCSRDIDPEDSVVVIMWPTSDRFVFWVDHTTPHLQSDLHNAVWLDGRRPQFVDYHGRYSDQQGFCLTGSNPRGYGNYYWKYLYNASQSVNDYFKNIVLTQCYLKNLGVRYLMATSVPLTRPVDLHKESFTIEQDIFSQIDTTKFVDNAQSQGLLTHCLDHGLEFLDRVHPAESAHRHYVDNVLKFRLEALIK